jgi:uncharacterized OsmC-like protein
MPMTASARSAHGSPYHTIDVNGRHTITTDAPDRLGGTDRAPAPHELLPAMLASCVSTMIRMTPGHMIGSCPMSASMSHTTPRRRPGTSTRR